MVVGILDPAITKKTVYTLVLPHKFHSKDVFGKYCDLVSF